ncbi:PglL family O-oligosaccharyltransferase [Rhodoferax koreense]|uniref:PglL family O-oligosaccharyltransferase n=1 Tax=Rhodoferax koreensis TaxID=1842727 RepID=UPI001EF59648|nr:Wzy polymerase domain-containing protein [Rhodoferax koreense]
MLPWLVAVLASSGLLLVRFASLFATSKGDGGAYSRPSEYAAQAWLIAGLLSSLIALIQYAGASAAFAPWINYTEAGEAFANLRQRNQFATLTNIALAALLWWTVQPRPLARQADAYGAALLMAVVLALGNAASSSRTGLLQLVMLIALVAWWGGWRLAAVRRLLLVFCGAYAAALWVLPWAIGLDPLSHGAWARMQAGDAICSSRITLWRNVLHLISLRPWFGWGWGELDYAHFVTPYDGPRFCDILDNAHNLPLHLAVELGIPVAVTVCGLLTWLVLRARPWQETDPTRQLAWAVLALIGLHSLLEYPLWYGPFQMAVGLCIVLLWPRSAEPASEKKRRLMQWSCALIASILLAACAYTGWDYRRISQIYLPPESRAEAYRGDTLAKIRDSWLFSEQVKFAELTITPLTPQNAEHMHALAEDLLHFSPEPRVVEKLIESALLLQRYDEARINLARFRAAFPDAHDRWAATHPLPF